jgi:hypothetical protein
VAAVMRRAHSARAALGRQLTVGLAGDLGDREAVRSLALGHLLGAPFAATISEQQAVIGVLVVGHQQAAVAAPVEREEAHAVVVHAHLHGLVGGAVAAVEPEGGQLAGHADRLTPGLQHLRRVALGHRHAIGLGERHRS